MKKLLLLLLIAGISYAQSGNPIVDSLSAHRTAIDSNRTDINALQSGIEFTGDVTFGDDDTLTFGAGNDLILYSNGSLGNIGGAGSIYLRPNNTSSWLFNSSGNFTPATTSTFNIGNADRYVGRIYADTVSVDTLLSMPDGADIKLGDGSDLQMTFSGTAGSIIQQGANLSIYGTGAYNLYFGTNTVLDWMINSSGDFTPYINEGADLGSTSKQVDTLYTEGINLDGTPLTSSAAELNYTDGVTSNIQTQLDAKMAVASVGAQIEDSLQAETHYQNFAIMSPQTTDPIIPLNLGDITITGVKVLVLDGTSVAWNLEYGATIGEGLGTDVFTSDQTTSASTAYASLTPDNVTPASTYGVWLDISAVSGTVDLISVVLEYTKD